MGPQQAKNASAVLPAYIVEYSTLSYRCQSFLADSPVLIFTLFFTLYYMHKAAGLSGLFMGQYRKMQIYSCKIKLSVVL